MTTSGDTLTGPHGETRVRGSKSELITLSTSALATDSAADLLPADSIIESVVIRIENAISGGANAKGTITLTGLPSIGVKAQGTITLNGAGDGDVPSVGAKSQGTITLSGAGVNDVPSVGVKSQGTITLTGVPLGTIAAQGTITLAGLPVADETFVIGAQTFTWKALRSATGEVTIGASAADCTENIVTAVNLDLATVVASLGVGETVVITAVTPGTAGNALTFTESSTNLTIDGAGTLGATTSGAAAETFTVGAQTFTWVTLRSGVGEVTLGASASACVINIIAAISSDLATVTAGVGAGETVIVTAASVGTAGDAIVFTESSSDLSVDGAGTLGTTTAGVDADTFTVDDQVFTWKVLRAGVGQVTLGATKDGCVLNIITAINADLSSVTATTGAGTTVVVTAATAGVAGDSIVLTESSGNLTVDGAGTLGATTAGVAVDTFTIGTQVFTWVTTRSGTGEVTLGIAKSSSVTNILVAIAADLVNVTAASGAGTSVIVTATAIGVAGNSIVLTESSTNLIVDGAGTLGTTTLGTAPDFFTVDDQVFTWKTTRAAIGEVTIGASAAAAATNIIASVNTDLTTVVASQGAGTTVVITAVVDGDDGTDIVLSESSANLTMDGAGTLGATQEGATITGYQVGDATTAARFAAASSTFTVGSTQVCLAHRQGGVSTDGTGPVQTTAAKLRITAVAAPPDRGAVWVTVNYTQFTAPTL